MDNAGTLQSDARRTAKASVLSRLIALPFGLVAYVVGVGGLAWYALSLAEVTTWPHLEAAGGMAGDLAVDLGLVLLFGLTHSVMARQGFKKQWTRIVPRWAERSTFVMTAGVVLAIMVFFWQPLPDVVWSVSGPWAPLLWGVCALGWLYLLLSTWAIDHFDLFGLRQTYLHAVGREYTPIEFKEKWMYGYSRHPIMAGVLLGVWATPHMTLGHLVMAVALSTYIVIGVILEERDLLQRFGDTYRRYQSQVGALFSMPGH
jgi:protein-S-isoprenylcysteine O-methyltransferase Ste14